MTLTTTTVSVTPTMFNTSNLFEGSLATNAAGDVLLVDDATWWSRHNGGWNQFITTSPAGRPWGIKLGSSDGTPRGIASSRHTGILLFGETQIRSRPRNSGQTYYVGGDDWENELSTGNLTMSGLKPRHDDFRSPVYDIHGFGTNSSPWLMRIFQDASNFGTSSTLTLGTLYPTASDRLVGYSSHNGVSIGDRQLVIPVYGYNQTEAVARLFIVSAANLTVRTATSPPLTDIRHTSNSRQGFKPFIRAIRVGNRVVIVFYDNDKRTNAGKPAMAYTIFDPALDSWEPWTDVDFSSTTFVSGVATRPGIVADPVSPDGTARWAIRDPDRLYLFEKEYNIPPLAPTLTRTPSEYLAAQSEPLRLDWVFNDPDPGDTQSAYMIRRTTGTDIRFRIASGGWQANDDNATIESADNSVTLAAGWGTSTQARHEYQVRTWDAASQVSPWSVASIVKAAPIPANGPVITEPGSNGDIVSSASFSIEWTFSSQVAYRLRVLGGNNTSPDTNQVFYDTGLVTSTSRVAHAPFPTNNVTRWVEVRCRYGGSVDSPVSNRRVQVTWSPPVIPTLSSVTADAGRGSLAVRWNTGATSASKPDAVEFHIYRSTASSGANPIRVGIVEGNTDNSNLVWHDYTVASEVEYWYQVQAIAADERASFSAWVG